MIARPGPTWWAVAIGSGLGWSLVVLLACRTQESSVVATTGLLLAAPTLGSLMATDLIHRRLPRMISYLGLIVSLPWLIASSRSQDVDFRGPIFGALAMTAIAVTLRILSRGALGQGDVHVAPLLGAIVGWFDPTLIPRVWLVATIFAGTLSIAVLALGGNRSERIPFGPALFFGVCATLLGS